MIVAGAIDAVRRTLERRCHLPPRRQPKAHFCGTRVLALFEHEQIRAEELREVLRRARDGEVDCVGRVVEVDDYMIGPTGDDAPRVFVGAVPTQRLAAGVLCAKPVDVARVVLDLVVARTPRGERDEECVLPRGRKVRRDVELALCDGDFIANRLRAEWQRQKQREHEAAGETTHHHSGQEVGPRRRAGAQVQVSL